MSKKFDKITENVGKAEEKTRKWLGKLDWGIASILIIMALFGKFDDAAAEAGIAGKADNREVTAEYTRDDGTKEIAVKTTDNTWVDENITTPSVKEKEVSEQEMVEISTDIEESVTESIEESTWGYPEEEQFLEDIGFNVNEISSANHLLYAYNAAKIACDMLNTNSFEDIREYVSGIYASSGVFDTGVLDGVIFGTEDTFKSFKEALGDDYDIIYSEVNAYIYGGYLEDDSYISESTVGDVGDVGDTGEYEYYDVFYSEYTLLDSSNVKDFFRTAQAGDKVEFYGEANVITDDLVYIHIFDQQYAVFDIVIENYSTRLFTDDKVHITGTFTGFMLNTPVVSVESIQIN